uniref:DUF3095 domain-containing protein n=1 Tax=Grammatophora oceanica TaxID=210454 RepID=A0A7S1UMT2_9STRA|mmetsp:Transcript_12761/g.18817  ORF Transcript_12761/g.18817 Transcript_12761/m.18817 type:complete len:583 (+) Transcript_12761:357-2105(+)|eukprot:CAMPEP_0194049562 /NCGR_PEP_ID=MMETSP0009_2-20130614/30753_1 /TAXON_ID=210454 /ORGANISM="Grammatophora oceanica, Strain CCMP 410" /LENGTH=582 /DNA_ID=CAMNT_0038695751 /DNA_START=356 /DNA_END=2107 /DNA_ORIENTATION=-
MSGSSTATVSTELYEDLESFSDFSSLSQEKYYVKLPSDWSVIIAYVVDAEEKEGNNYKEVNSMGGGCVTAVKNALNGKQVPYVFTGDGGSFAVPADCYDRAVGALLSFRQLVRKNFKSDLCIGSMTVGEIEEQSQTTVEVARYEIAHGVCIALFRGGGLAYASTQVGRVSAGEHNIEDDAVPPVQVALDGLSCRWKPMPSKHGTVLSILVYENPDRINSGVYDDVLHELDCILDFKRSNPAHMDKSGFKSVRTMMKDDKKFHFSRCNMSYFARFAEMCLGVVVYRWGILKNAVFNSQYYRFSQREHADYRKFDDMLRMVVDCTLDQAKAIEFVLQDRFNQGHLFYGIFSSSHAVMTCLLEGLEDGQHIHFMDGADGGYTMAAKAMREQMDTAMKLKPRYATGWSAPSSTVLDEELGCSQTDTEPMDPDMLSQHGGGLSRRSSRAVSDDDGGGGGPWGTTTRGIERIEEHQQELPAFQFDPTDGDAFHIMGQEQPQHTSEEEDDGLPEKKQKKKSSSKKKKKKKSSSKQKVANTGTTDIAFGGDIIGVEDNDGGKSSRDKSSSKKSKKKNKVVKHDRHVEVPQ